MSTLYLPDGSAIDTSSRHVELTPSERNALTKCSIDEQRSAQCMDEFHAVDDVDSLRRAVDDFARRLTARIAEKGFRALVSTDLRDPDNFDFLDNGALVWHPKVSVVERLEGEYSLERDMWETRHGVEDGRVGRLVGGRTWSDEPDARRIIG